MKVKRKEYGTIGVLAESAHNNATYVVVVWEKGNFLWKATEQVKNLIFIVPAPTRRIINA